MSQPYLFELEHLLLLRIKLKKHCLSGNQVANGEIEEWEIRDVGDLQVLCFLLLFQFQFLLSRC